MREKNRCKTCRVLSLTTCPILGAAYQKHGWKHLEECEIAEVVDKVWAAAKDAGKNLAGKVKKVA